MKNHRIEIFSLLALVPMAGCQSVPVDNVPEPGAYKRSGEIHLAVSTSRTSYRPGETLEFTVIPSEDVYLAAWIRGDYGRSRQIYPNQHDPGRIFRRGSIARFPTAGGFLFQVTPPAGYYTLTVMASTQPFDFSSPPPSGGWVQGVAIEPGGRKRTGEARVVFEVTP